MVRVDGSKWESTVWALAFEYAGIWKQALCPRGSHVGCRHHWAMVPPEKC